MEAQRTEIIILDDSEQVRAEIAAEVRRIFPDLNISESGDAEKVMKAIDEFAAKILILISDSQMRDSIEMRLAEKAGDVGEAKERSSFPNPDGMDIVQSAKRAGIPHVAYYSINSSWAGEMMKGDGIVCITKPSHGCQGKDGHEDPKHPALKAWLEGIRATISSETPPR